MSLIFDPSPAGVGVKTAPEAWVIVVEGNLHSAQTSGLQPLGRVTHLYEITRQCPLGHPLVLPGVIKPRADMTQQHFHLSFDCSTRRFIDSLHS